jgi:DNA-binding transcriptional MerR regulator
MKIGELSDRTSVPTKTIRYYEEVGVLPPARRSPNGYRQYGEDAIGRLEFVKDAQATGLSLDEITTVMRLRSEGLPTCGHVTVLLESHLEHLEARIEALRATRARLVEIIDRARTLDPAECSDPHRCQVIGPTEGPTASAVAHELHGAPEAHDHH